ncbi:MAG: hypothetical protein L3K11_04395 [Thermoplasmata archaeon]|nr:hypothetical protein [Thermoplasmata archaeon]
MTELERASAPILAVAGVSATGKTTTLDLLRGSRRRAVLAEPWAALRPRPRLDVRNRAELRGVERRLLREEIKRFRRAERIAAGGRTVWLDTPPVGPLTYARAVSALLGWEWDATRIFGAADRTRAAPPAIQLPHLTIYLRTPIERLLARAFESSGGRDPSLAVRHLVVGLVEQEFWLTDFRVAFPARLRVMDGEIGPGTVVELAQRWEGDARRAGTVLPEERGCLERLLRRPARLPRRFAEPGRMVKPAARWNRRR